MWSCFTSCSSRPSRWRIRSSASSLGTRLPNGTRRTNCGRRGHERRLERRLSARVETEGKPVEREAQWLPLAGSTMASGPQEPVGAISLLEAAEWVLANWRWTVGTAVLLAALFFYRAARIPVTYTATAMFLPQAGGTTDAEGTIMGPLGALSGLLG